MRIGYTGLIIILISPVVHGRRHDDWSDRTISSSSSYVRRTPKPPRMVAYHSYRTTTTIPNTTMHTDELSDMDDVYAIPNHNATHTASKSSSSEITLVTPTSVVNDDRGSPDMDLIWNVPTPNSEAAVDRISASDININTNDDVVTPLEQDSVIRLKYQSKNFINENSRYDNDDDDSIDDVGILKSSRSSSSSSSSGVSDTMRFPPLQTPIVYRYYPRHQSRTISAGSVPFVLLGPNVDHWKLVAQQLALRGFNVIAVGPKDQILPSTTTSSTTKTKPSYELGLSSLSTVGVATKNSNKNDRYLEGPGLVLQLLDALRWKKIILVGCDSEAALAIQAALLLPPDRIAGLILCGNMQESEMTFLEYSAYRCGPFDLDRFLQERLSCPFTIVWDGTSDKATVSSSSMTTLDNVPILMSSKSPPGGSTSTSSSCHRSVIIGGGTSPHRRRPGIFAWILTRFVEERIAPAVSIQSFSSSTTSATVRTPTGGRIPSSSKETTPQSSVVPVWLSSLPIWKLPARIPVLWNVDDMFNEESMVVFGRIVATAIFYAISLKVLVYQYGNIRDVIDFVTCTPRHIISMVRNRVSNIATILLFIGRIPFLILPTGRRTSQSNETQIENDATISSKDDQQDEERNNTQDRKDDQEKSESTPDNDLRPFFFLDHVVA